MIMELTPQEQEVIKLVYIVRLSRDKVADKLGITVKEVKGIERTGIVKILKYIKFK